MARSFCFQTSLTSFVYCDRLFLSNAIDKKGGITVEVPYIYDGEYRLAQLIWENAPMSTRALVRLAEERLSWKRTTTYTVLKKLCELGLFCMENRTVTVLIPKEQVQLRQSEVFLERTFKGSLPGFIAAFVKEKRLSAKELDEIRRLIDGGEGSGDA
ncbi:MAG: BlaI/MecI/CopY family transcriptional regulator [Clostridia bacterium]|nr:BlaI/MecI/CopY family transcriptional regulator [Clostridia bacterium]